MGKRHSKRYRQAVEKIPAEPVPVRQAVEILQQFPPSKFDATVELVVRLGIDPKKADQALRGAVSLPHGIGANRQVVAFCEENDVEAAKRAGAVDAGCDELIEKIQGGWADFDVAVASPSVMKKVSRLGRILGPQGKMPSPKSGTVTEDIVQAVKDYSAGKVEYRNDEGGNLHLPVGKTSFDADKLSENVESFLAYIRKMKPASAKGTYIKNACLSATMTPAVRLDVA